MSIEGRLFVMAWLLLMAAGLVATVGLPAGLGVLTDMVQLALGAVFER